MKNANLVSHPLLVAVVIAATALGAACARKDAAASGAPPINVAAPKSGAHFFPIRIGEQTVRMQIAVRPAEHQRGLMERRDLGRDDGMIFIYEKPQQLSFWMKNTPTPLDIGYLNAAGVLEEIYQMHPFDETTVSSRGTQLQFALEMNQGWYRTAGIKPGARLDLAALAAALRERGMDPAKFGLGAATATR
ncbi:MAG: DUF192 domain-containing protein [Opitutaceae bacterium]|nr:DUF192 domain-containing protein [Opitutaceae bacterium]